MNFKDYYQEDEVATLEFKQRLDEINKIEGWMWPDEAFGLFSAVSYLPKSAKVVEIGSYKGKSSTLLKDYDLTCVDSWDLFQGVSGDKIYADFRFNCADFVGRINVIRGTSIEASRRFADGSLDMIFLDADHSYDAVKADLEAWWPKLRGGGVFCGHDYDDHGWPGLVKAVREFMRDKGVEILHGKKHITCGSFWACQKPATFAVNMLVTSNRGKYLKYALESLLHQDDKDFEIVITCDATDDETLEVVRAYENNPFVAKVNYIDPTIEMTPLRNKMLKYSKARGSKYMLYFDDDDISLPWRISETRKQMEAGVELYMARCAYIYEDWNVSPPDPWGYHIPVVNPRTKKPENIGIESCTACLNIDSALSLGGFAENWNQVGSPYHTIIKKSGIRPGDDCDLFRRMYQAGMKYHRSENVISLYRMHGGQVNAQ